MVYFFWGSTYLAIRIGVETGSGFPPFILGALRTLVGGSILLLWCVLRKNRLRLSGRQTLHLAISGILLWVGGNGLVNWAEQHADSGYSALLVGALPIWMAIMEAVLDRRRPTLPLIIGILTGFIGLIVLTFPVIQHGNSHDWWAVVGLLLAPLFWGAGSLVYQRNPTNLPAVASAAYQQLFGGVGFAIVSFATHEPMLHPTPHAWFAWAYLVVAGSLFAFTAFLTALQLLPISLVATYAYVNPVIAVFLGWLFLNEPVTGYTFAGTGLIMVGVFGVFRAKHRIKVN